MHNTHNLQNWKEITKENALLFVVLTTILTIVLNRFADKGLTYLLNINNQTIFTYNYSLGISGIMLAIPSALFSIWIIKGALKFEERFLPAPILNKFGNLPLWCFSLLLKLIKVMKIMATYALYLVFVIAGFFADGSSRGGYSPSSGSVSLGSNNSNGRENLKEEAERQARQKQQEADYAWKQAQKQANYNINTYHFDNRVNRANALQREANEAKKRARNL
ncbi:hypothetical protein [Pontibacillus litoralis]|uniref:Uncharacterized protein n=1 Tax=Pontibacillus litoralis JSM 072002 TaxID=1385512 RepID=A0A0A5GDD6_9BACI|nr:hypothetical protein [Pontibacillus litoralis]KGX89223.1 hypothetical protein N784_02335 [Pontibacillus litoralis JSM 072002]